ncbi:hypothetical protein MZM54_01105 [[Brevibacterium] frigoritolerans]|nr:hypothetical protein [Peribacillus frigoritolerans]
MNRKEIITEFKRRYLKNESVTEKDVVVNDLQFFHLVLEEFGSWHKLVKEVGILNRHLKEREKYYLYLMMKERKERFPSDVLRKKNIEPEIKEKIANGFGTIKKLTHEILDGWNQDRVIYEAHTYFITGGTPELLSKKNPILSENIAKFFADEAHFYDEYQRRFLIQPLEEIQTQQEIQEPEEVPAAQGQGLDISALLLAVGYLDKDKADNIAAAEKTSIEEVQEFVNNLDPNMTESQLAEENARMFLAVVNKFGNLSNARQQQNVNTLKKA